jgi:8-oxo-dGTP diphosphatase
VERYKVISAVFLIFRRDDHILMLRRAHTGHRDGWLSLPAGHLDGGESATAATVREAKEEVGVTLQVENLKFVHAIHRRAEEDLAEERIDLYFEVLAWEGEIINAEPHKCSELVWAAASDLPDDVIPYVRSVIEEVQAGSFYSEFGWS